MCVSVLLSALQTTVMLADAVQGPLTAADVPLAKHTESLAEKEAPSTTSLSGPSMIQISSALLKVTCECRRGPEAA